MNPAISFDNNLLKQEAFSYDDQARPFIPGGVPGSAIWINDASGRPAVLRFVCPCGCGYVGGIVMKISRPDGWTLTGELSKPTLEPSIQMLSPCRWHGYLRNGVFEKC